MNPSPLLVQCPNPNCLHAENVAGQPLCDRCQTPLDYRYLWAVGKGVEQLPLGDLLENRYSVFAPRVLLDTQPAIKPTAPEELPAIAASYLRLFPHRLHVPVVYAICQLEDGNQVLLLENAPLDTRGHLYATIASAWSQATAVRQVYWLWQLLELWQPLEEIGALSSLLKVENLRVEGWRVRLRELTFDQSDADAPVPQLKHLASVWQTWLDSAQELVRQPLQALCQQMQTVENSEAGLKAIATSLNQILLEQAAQLPLKLKIAGATSSGPQRSHNEDACYPLTVGVKQPSNDPLIPNLAIVCDGIGGHAGGEVASQMALRSLQLQILALLGEIAEQTDLTPPEVVAYQLEAIVRVVNNVIAEQNNAQGRESRQRMGTTLVMALQFPQNIATPTGFSNTHELYLVNVGDSRAYWLTPRYCHLLTVDDDVASRDVWTGRNLYRESLARNDAGALIQAIGTREGDSLRPTVQRFILEEDGLLLLCSDGLSDGDRVEAAWEETTRLVLKGNMSLEAAVQSWVNLANQLNGHDNTSVVILHCQVSPENLQLFVPEEPTQPPTKPIDAELSASARALLYDAETPAPTPPPAAPAPAAKPAPRPKSPATLNLWTLTLGTAVLMFVLGALVITAWRQADPVRFQRTFERLFSPASQPPPSRP